MFIAQQTRKRITAPAGEVVLPATGTPFSRSLRSLALIPLAFCAVVLAAGLFPELFRSGEAVAEPAVAETAAVAETEAEATLAPDSAIEGKFIEAGGYSLPLPADWRPTRRPPGSAFAAVSNDGLATTTLWIEHHPGLDFEAFEKRELRSISMLGAKARVTDRVEGASIESSSAQLRADLPAGAGLTSPYLVTLRASGPYRYHLATTIQAGSPRRVLADAEALTQRLRPWLSGG